MARRVGKRRDAQGRRRDARGRFAKAPPRKRPPAFSPAELPGMARLAAAAMRAQAAAKRKPTPSKPKRTPRFTFDGVRWKDARGRFVKAPTWRQVRRDRADRPIDASGRQVPAAAVRGRKAPAPTPPKPKRAPRFTFDGARWKDARGRFVKAPTWRQVRRDRADRPIDASGRQVPAAAVRGRKAPAPKPPKLKRAKRTPAPVDLAYDKRAKRWRFRGRFVAAPAESELRHDLADRPIDITDKPVPRSRLAPVDDEAAPAAPTTPLVTLPKGAQLASADRFLNASHLNRATLSAAGEVLAKAFSGHAERIGRDASDFGVFEYGIQARPRHGGVSEEMLGELREALRDTGATLQVIHEGEGVESVRVVFGDKDVMLTAPEISSRLLQWGPELASVHDIMDAYWDQWDWAAQWETDEDMYEAAA